MASSTVRAGAGPFVALGHRNLGGVDVRGVSLGAEPWSGNGSGERAATRPAGVEQ